MTYSIHNTLTLRGCPNFRAWEPGIGGQRLDLGGIKNDFPTSYYGDVRMKITMGRESTEHGKRGETGREVPLNLPWSRTSPHNTGLGSRSLPSRCLPLLSISSSEPRECPLSIIPFRAQIGPFTGDFSKAELAFKSPWQFCWGRFVKIFLTLALGGDIVWGEVAVFCGLPDLCKKLPLNLGPLISTITSV